MKEKADHPETLFAALGVVGFGVLIAMTLAQRLPPIFDEVPHLELANRLATSHSFISWLRENDISAPGPLHPVMHYLLSGGSGHLPAPWFRLVNLVLLGGMLALLAWVLRLRGQPNWKVWSVFGVPMVWGFAGMALTELPAMIGLALAVGAAIWLGRNPDDRRRPWALAGLGVGTALSLLGRQTYLVVLPTLGWLALTRRGWLAPLIVLVLSAIPIGIVFCIWGGTVPPLLAYVSGGLVPEHALLALGVCGALVALVAPGFLLAHLRWTLPAGVVTAVINLSFRIVKFTTLTSLQRMMPYPAISQAVEAALGIGFAALGGAWVAAVAAEIKCRRDREFTGLAVAVVLLCAACAAIAHIFSSRYAGMTLPFLVPMLAPWIIPGRWAVIRLAVAMTIGAAVLYSYYLAHTPGAL